MFDIKGQKDEKLYTKSQKSQKSQKSHADFQMDKWTNRHVHFENEGGFSKYDS